MASRVKSPKDARRAAIERAMKRMGEVKTEIGDAKRLERPEPKEKIRIDYRPSEKEMKKREKTEKNWKKDPRSKVEQLVGRASAPMNDITELSQQIGSRVRGKKAPAWGGPLGYMRKNLRDLGMGQKTADKIKKAQSQPVSGVAIERRLQRKQGGKAERGF